MADTIPHDHPSLPRPLAPKPEEANGAMRRTRARPQRRRRPLWLFMAASSASSCSFLSLSSLW
eukprot:4353120-Alexandrium_andersonii.AAC.1